jgi:glycosyltransferase involved in cell wall biosynthesis
LNVGVVVPEILDGRFVPWEKGLEWESYVDFYCLALARRGHKAVKYVPSIGVSKPTAYVHRFGHTVKRIPVYNRLLAPRALLRPRKYESGYTTDLRPLLGPSFTLNLMREASADRVNILHYASYYSLFFVPSFIAAPRFVVVGQYTGGSLPSRPLSRAIWSALLLPAMGASKAILLGDYSSEIVALTRYLNVAPSKQKHFDAPIFDKQFFHELDKGACRRELGMDPKRRIILSVTFIPSRHSIDLAKNPFLLVDIFAEAVRHGLVDADLHIVGWGPGEGELREYVRGNGLSEMVKLYGLVEHRRLPTYYSAADLVFLPYPLERLNEGSVTIEAFACSRPVAAFKRHATDNTEQYGGLLVETDTEAGAKTLLTYAKNDEYLERKGLEGLEYSSQFTVEFAGRRLEEIYSEVSR